MKRVRYLPCSRARAGANADFCSSGNNNKDDTQDRESVIVELVVAPDGKASIKAVHVP